MDLPSLLGAGQHPQLRVLGRSVPSWCVQGCPGWPGPAAAHGRIRARPTAPRAASPAVWQRRLVSMTQSASKSSSENKNLL